jgi:hypothetical protein
MPIRVHGELLSTRNIQQNQALTAQWTAVILGFAKLQARHWGVAALFIGVRVNTPGLSGHGTDSSKAWQDL